MNPILYQSQLLKLIEIKSSSSWFRKDFQVSSHRVVFIILDTFSCFWLSRESLESEFRSCKHPSCSTFKTCFGTCDFYSVVCLFIYFFVVFWTNDNWGIVFICRKLYRLGPSELQIWLLMWICKIIWLFSLVKYCVALQYRPAI